MANANAAASRTADASRPRARATFQDFLVLIDQERYRYGGKPGRSRSPCFRAQASCRRSAPRSRTEGAARRGLLRATRAFFFQSSQSLSFRDIAQSLAALPADTVLEENVAASLAAKEFHVGRAILRRYRPAGALAGPSLRRQALPIERMVGFWVICGFCPWSGPYRGDAGGPVGSCLPSLSALNSRRLWRSARIARQRPCGR